MKKIITKLSFLDRYLTLWLLLAAAVGIFLGWRETETVARVDAATRIGVTSVPLALFLMLMLYPPLARVKYEEMGRAFSNKKLLIISLAQNWLAGPVLMTALAIVFLRNTPEYMLGVILIGLARCPAAVIVWNGMARGDIELCAGLSAVNAVFQIVLFPVYAWFFAGLVPHWLGLGGAVVTVTFSQIAKRMLVYICIPFMAAIITRFVVIGMKGWEWYYKKFIPAITPLSLIAMLFTISCTFALRGDDIVAMPMAAARVAVPLLLYFPLMFFSSFYLAKKNGASYAESATLSFTSATSNSELAMAAAIATFNIDHGSVFATVIGPLVGVFVLIGFVNVSLWIGRRWYKAAPARTQAALEIRA